MPDPDIMDFGRKSFITWTEADLRAEREFEREPMHDKKYLCLSDDALFTKDELHQCPKCGEYSCPDCGGEVQTIEEYDKAMRINSEEP